MSFDAVRCSCSLWRSRARGERHHEDTKIAAEKSSVSLCLCGERFPIPRDGPSPHPALQLPIDVLRRTGVTLAITSSAVRSSIEEILVRLGLRDAFSLIVDGSEVVHGKPDPEAYLVTAKRLGVSPYHCIVFEDSEVGVRAAKAAGMYCVAVRNPNALTRQDLSIADVIVESMREVDVDYLLT